LGRRSGEVRAPRQQREQVSQPQGQTHRRNPGPSSPNEPGGIFTANLKDLELANRPTTTLAEVADATTQGIQRVCKRDDPVTGFLGHTGLTLDP
jgi:hypothetical protein